MIELGPTSVAPLGTSVGLGCPGCPLYEICGGTYTGFDCMTDCCQKPEKCTTACPRSYHFSTVVEDAGGLDPRRKWGLSQQLTELPSYIPHLHHGFRRDRLFDWDTVALTTFDVVKPAAKKRIHSASQLRAAFKLAADASVLLLSIGKDNRLESLWERFHVADVANWLSALDIQHVTVPNFSFPIDVPRPEHMTNRMRSLYCAERLSEAGLSVILHLNAYTEKDWGIWCGLLREHPQIKAVALEFQTGLAAREKAIWHISQLRNLREVIGRDLHLVAVAGRRHLRELSHFKSLTIVDSAAFFKSLKRRIGCEHNNGAMSWKLMPDMPVDVLLQYNAALCRSSLQRKLAFIRQFPDLARPERETFREAVHDPNQLTFDWSPSTVNACLVHG